MSVEELIEKKPFAVLQKDKDPLFFEIMVNSFKHHYDGNFYFKKFVDASKFDVNKAEKTECFPFLPVSVFKEINLVTGPENAIKKKVQSSSTSSAKPSSVFLDTLTINRQRSALVSILSDFLGNKKKIFYILDSRATLESKNMTHVSSRASAIRGILPFAKKIQFLLDDNLKFDRNLIKEGVRIFRDGDEAVWFGFTWLIYNTIKNLNDNNELRECFRSLSGIIQNKGTVLHIGGWKKLAELNIGKNQFNKYAARLFSTDSKNVLDFYGMTEQLGTVYPDCAYGFKHVPMYSEVIMRDTDTLLPLTAGKTGFIQLLSPLPNSYPGISIISDDLGEIAGVDDCKCGRKGKYFIFKKRAEKAEIKGCGDTYEQ